jgi:Phospholipase A2-like domain
MNKCLELLLYCFKCKKKTKSDHVDHIETANGKWRIISNCCICGCKKSSFTKKSGGDLVDWLSNKLGEIHLPGHNFTGPGTKLDERLARGDQPVNKIDALAKEHDIAYKESKDKPNKKELRHKADREMIKKLNELENLTIGEHIEKRIVKPVLKTKLLLGLGIDEKL